MLSNLRELRPAPDAYLTLPRIEYCVPGRGFFLPARVIASACYPPAIVLVGGASRSFRAGTLLPHQTLPAPPGNRR